MKYIHVMEQLSLNITMVGSIAFTTCATRKTFFVVFLDFACGGRKDKKKQISH